MYKSSFHIYIDVKWASEETFAMLNMLDAPEGCSFTISAKGHLPEKVPVDSALISDRIEELNKYLDNSLVYTVFAGPMDNDSQIFDVLSRCDDIWHLPANMKLDGKWLAYHFVKTLKNMKLRSDSRKTDICLDTVIDSSPSFIWFKDNDGIHMKVNDSLCNSVGKTKKAVENKEHISVWNAKPEVYRENSYVCADSDGETIRAGHTCVFDERINIADGIHQLKVYKSPLKDYDGRIFGTSGIAIDVTDINCFNSVIDFFIESLPFGIVICDKRMKISAVNSMYYKLVGDDRSILGQNYHKWRQRVFGIENDCSKPFVIKYNIDGKERDLNFTDHFIDGIPGEEAGKMAHISDVSEWVKNRDELIRQKKLAEQASEVKTQFVSRISHEIRTPLNVIFGMTEMLSKSYLDDTQMKYVESIKSGARVLLGIVDDVLDFSKIEAGNLEVVNAPYDLKGLLDDLYLMASTKIGNKHVSLEFNLPEGMPNNLIGDEVRVRQILHNLLTNSIKYTEKGSISLQINYKLCDDGRYKFTFAVKDTGIGIKEEDLDKIFVPFIRSDADANTSIEGKGLGLSIVKELAESMEGSIFCDSIFGSGTVFTVNIVQSICGKDTESERVSHLNITHDFMLSGVKALIVDDNTMNLEVARGFANLVGASCDVCSNGGDAVAMVKKEKYDIIFMDRMMPGMSGEDTIRAIRNIGTDYALNIPIVAMTADISAEGKLSMEEAGANDYMTKPVEIGKWRSVIRTWIPKDKIRDKAQDMVKTQEGASPLTKWERIAGEYLDINEGLKMCGGDEIFIEAVKCCIEIIDSKINLISSYLDDIKTNIKNYTIEVHGLKSTCRTIGAGRLADAFYELELFGKSFKYDAILLHSVDALDGLRELKPILMQIAGVEEAEKVTVDYVIVKDCLNTMRKAVDDFDLNLTDKMMEELKTFSLPENIGSLVDKLSVYVTNIDNEGIEKTIDEMLGAL